MSKFELHYAQPSLDVEGTRVAEREHAADAAVACLASVRNIEPGLAGHIER